GAAGGPLVRNSYDILTVLYEPGTQLYRPRGGFPMKLTVFGATGAIGGLLIDQALDRGWHVTAVVRRGIPRQHNRLTVVQVPDLTEVDALRPAVEGREAVVSGIGPRSSKYTTVASSTGLSII